MADLDKNNINEDSPYGLTMDNRKYQGESYQFGFQGMEKETKQPETQYHTLFRQYDAALGRWWSIDPEQDRYAAFSPFLAMGANPVNMGIHNISFFAMSLN